MIICFSLILMQPSFGSKDVGKQDMFDIDGCSEGWYITGYFTPMESDYRGPTQTIQIKPEAQSEERSFVKSFLDEVYIEGWGKTLRGDYIHPDPSDNKWYSAPIAKDALDDRLVKGKTVAVDTELIEFGIKLNIPSLISPWNSFTYIAMDIGGSIKGKNIDIYTGEGKNAKEETFKITGDDGVICKL